MADGRLHRTGSDSPECGGGHRRPVLGPYRDLLRALVEEKSGIRLSKRTAHPQNRGAGAPNHSYDAQAHEPNAQKDTPDGRAGQTRRSPPPWRCSHSRQPSGSQGDRCRRRDPSVGASLPYLPPCSPEPNPIERQFHKARARPETAPPVMRRIKPAPVTARSAWRRPYQAMAQASTPQRKGATVVLVDCNRFERAFHSDASCIDVAGRKELIDNSESHHCIWPLHDVRCLSELH